MITRPPAPMAGCGTASHRDREKGPLRWHDRESFFDPGVQAVLRERHPARGDFGKNGFKGYPIDAWRAVDDFARSAGFSTRSLAEFGVYMQLDALWTSRLLEAMVRAQEAARPGKQGAELTPNARRENQRRQRIMQDWAECWIAHYRLHPLRQGCSSAVMRAE